MLNRVFQNVQKGGSENKTDILGVKPTYMYPWLTSCHTKMIGCFLKLYTHDATILLVRLEPNV